MLGITPPVKLHNITFLFFFKFYPQSSSSVSIKIYILSIVIKALYKDQLINNVIEKKKFHMNIPK